ncbi:aldehyde dehydrogenase family protein [Micromonospora sp. NPDC048898]|uniref:aldehyde dehydrogenase family protein n=1 Tax=Micromonospora sp. NPDC048898 TaxID=3364260 RepID=UPI003712993A
MTATELFIGGVWGPAASGRRFDVVNPSTGRTIASVADGDVQDALAAVDAAAAAASGWAATAPRERAEILRRAFELATRKIAPALAAGCTMILKPASDTPLTALALAELLTEAGVPAGVVNVVASRSSGRTVAAMLHDPRVRKLSFTGSTELGRRLLKESADQVVNTSMELGGNAPFVVFADADLEAAVDGAMIAKMRNAGEACTAANPFCVEEPVAAEFGHRLAEWMAEMVVGPATDPATPTAAPIERQNVTIALAAPRSSGRTASCTEASTIIGTMPIPTPMTRNHRPASTAGVPGPSVLSRGRPATWSRSRVSRSAAAGPACRSIGRPGHEPGRRAVEHVAVHVAADAGHAAAARVSPEGEAGPARRDRARQCGVRHVASGDAANALLPPVHGLHQFGLVQLIGRTPVRRCTSATKAWIQEST